MLHADSLEKSELCLDRLPKWFWLLAAFALFLAFPKAHESRAFPTGLCAACISAVLSVYNQRYMLTVWESLNCVPIACKRWFSLLA